MNLVAHMNLFLPFGLNHSTISIYRIHVATCESNNITLDFGIHLSIKKIYIYRICIEIHSVRFQGFGRHTLKKQHYKLNMPVWEIVDTHSTNQKTRRLQTWTSSLSLVPFWESILSKEKDLISKDGPLQFDPPSYKAYRAIQMRVIQNVMIDPINCTFHLGFSHPMILWYFVSICLNNCHHRHIYNISRS